MCVGLVGSVVGLGLLFWWVLVWISLRYGWLDAFDVVVGC